MTVDARRAAPRYAVYVRTWQNGRLIDEQLVCQAATFEEATAAARRLTDRRVSHNNEDVTTAIVPLHEDPP